jgi:hypothetical protein
VSRLRDHQRLPHAHDALCFAEDRLDAPWVLIVGGDLERTLRRFDVLEADDASFRLRNRFLSEDGDVAVRELDLRRDQLGQIVPLTDLR